MKPNPKDEARRAISTFVRGSIPTLRACLELTAQGIPETDAKGKVLRDDNGCVRWAYKPNPGEALKISVGLIDFYMPKMSASRTESYSESTVVDRRLRDLPTDDLLRLRDNALRNLQDGELVGEDDDK